MYPENVNNEMYWDYLRKLGKERAGKDWAETDYEKYLEDTTKLRIGCGLFMFLVLIVIVVGLSLLGAR